MTNGHLERWSGEIWLDRKKNVPELAHPQSGSLNYSAFCKFGVFFTVLCIVLVSGKKKKICFLKIFKIPKHTKKSEVKRT